MKSLSEIRHLLVIAAQKEYDDRIARGIHPYAIASYHLSSSIDNELSKHIITKDWKAGNWKALDESYDSALYPDTIFHRYGKQEGPFAIGLWAVAAHLNSARAWSTPGFAEAYQNHCLENN